MQTSSGGINAQTRFNHKESRFLMTNDNDRLKTVEFQLSNGARCIINEADADLLRFNWGPLISPRNKNIYAKSSMGMGGKEYLLHRVILGRVLQRDMQRREFVDHIDLNSLNCTRENLRLATVTQNAANARLYSTNTSGYRGVSFNKVQRKWQAKIRINGKLKHLGVFDSCEEAYEVYKIAAISLWGEFARL
jgi:HNH endonuclease